MIILLLLTIILYYYYIILLLLIVAVLLYFNYDFVYAGTKQWPSFNKDHFQIKFKLQGSKTYFFLVFVKSVNLADTSFFLYI